MIKVPSVCTMIPMSLLIMGLVMFGGFSIVKGAPNTHINKQLCNAGTYKRGSGLGKSVSYVLNKLTRVAPTTKGYNYYTTSLSGTPLVYGHATCNKALRGPECASCLFAAKKALSSGCPLSVGGQVHMVDCTMRFERYSFT